MKNLKLYANCKPTKGFRRSIIIDLQFGRIIPIPNSLQELLEKYDGENIDIILKHHRPEDHETIKEYYQFLLEQRLIFECSEEEVSYFPDLYLDWDYHSQITNAVIEYNKTLFPNIIRELDKLNCKAINLIIDKATVTNVKEILHELKNTSFLSFDFQINHFDLKELKELIQFVNLYPRVQNIYIFNCQHSQIIPQKNFNIYLSIEKYSPNSCGNISYYNFSINIPFFTESQQYNTCLNRKVSIDEQGNIKNCPSMKKHYGNIKDTCINDVIATKEFQKLWHIKKDDVKVCNDCEFRHMCTDCRVFLKDSNDLHSQPAKCDYNPYISKWKGEEGYEPVEKWQLANQ